MTTEASTEYAARPEPTECVLERDSAELKSGSEAKELLQELQKYNPTELQAMIENTQMLKLM